MSDAIKLAIEALEAAIPACELQGDKPGQLRWHVLSDQLTAALAALRAQPAGWMPIENAPKDGTLLMLWESYEDEPFIGRWHDFRSRWIASTAHYNTDGDACVIDTVCSEGVTHWMPLPPPPGQERAQPADPFKKLSDAQVLWLAESHGIDVYASNPLAFYADLISTTPAQPDHSEQHLEMVAAARAVVDRWDTPLWKDAPATAGFINRLRDALPAIGETT